MGTGRKAQALTTCRVRLIQEMTMLTFLKQIGVAVTPGIVNAILGVLYLG